MLIRADLAGGRLNTRVAIEDDLDQIVIFHAKPFSKLLARGLELRTDEHAAQIKEDSLDAHLLFFEVFRPLDEDVAGVFLAGALLPSSERAAGFVPVSFFVAGFGFVLASGSAAAGSGFDPSSAMASGAGAACCGCSFISVSNSFSSSRHLGIAISKRWRGMGVARRQRGQCAS